MRRAAAEMSDRFAAAHCASGVVSDDPPAAPGIPVLRTMGSIEQDRGRQLGDVDAAAQSLSPMPPEAAPMDNPRRANGVVMPFVDMPQPQPACTWSRPTVNATRTSRSEYAASTLGRSKLFGAVVVEGQAYEYPKGINHLIEMADPIRNLIAAQRLA